MGQTLQQVFLENRTWLYEKLTFSVEISNLLRAYLLWWANHYCWNDERQIIKWSKELKTDSDSQNNAQITKERAEEPH